MKVFLGFCILFVALFSKVVIAAECTIDQAVGRVIGVEWDASGSNAYVMRAESMVDNRVKVQPYLWLCGNDRIEIADGTKVIISLVNREQKTCTRDASCTLPHNVNIIKPSPFFDRIFHRLRFNATYTKPIPIVTATRSLRVILLANDPLLPSGIQYLPHTYEKVVLLWRNGPAEVMLVTADKEIKLSSGNSTYLIVDLPKEQSEGIQINLPNMGWHIKRASAPPVPEEMDQFDSTSLPDRLVRALWILKNGPDEWRLFALSELEGLSRAGFFAAEQLWHAALSGELAEVMKEE